MGIVFHKAKGEHPTLEELVTSLCDVRDKLEEALLMDLDYFINASRNALPDVMSEIESHVRHQDIIAFRSKLCSLLKEYENITGCPYLKLNLLDM
jgi:hypothetical protein